MQTFPELCSPERVRALQNISDAVWLVEIHAGSRRPTMALRDEIARRVAEHVGDADLNVDTIGRAVLTADVHHNRCDGSIETNSSCGNQTVSRR